ncbi:MAG: hypothetical protein ACJ8CR_24070, partial [Roseiflexaceae bacterium]
GGEGATGQCPPGTIELPLGDGWPYCHPVIMPQMQLEPAVERFRFGEKKECPVYIPTIWPDGTIGLVRSEETETGGDEDENKELGGESLPPYQ